MRLTVTVCFHPVLKVLDALSSHVCVDGKASMDGKRVIVVTGNANRYI